MMFYKHIICLFKTTPFRLDPTPIFKTSQLCILLQTEQCLVTPFPSVTVFFFSLKYFPVLP